MERREKQNNEEREMKMKTRKMTNKETIYTMTEETFNANYDLDLLSLDALADALKEEEGNN
jgi:hypothetical protein